jgi:hypothetical protein
MTMAQTKKDFIRAVEIVKNAYWPKPSQEKEVSEHLINAFVAFFRAENPRFDVERFREACK